jgi:UDP-GlcNAc:undecaprenyl-phosphate GlcNAc-1-phosphate transferase
VGIFLSFSICLIVAALTTGRVIGAITWPMLIGVIAGGAILIVGGALDDIKNLPPRLQILFPLAATLDVIFCGVGVSKLSSPFGGIIYLAAPLSGLVIFPYIMGTTYATKFFDGLDGLVTGLAAIGALLIMILALTTRYFQPDVALIAAITLGAFAGFLPWNFHPAKIYLGEGGALFAGYILGVLSIISGAKIAVVLMALGVAVVDAAWVILRRALWERRSPVSADRKHLHHRLLDAGWSQRNTVLFIWFVSAAFGAATLLLQSAGKLVAFILLAFVTLTVGVAAILKRKK